MVHPLYVAFSSLFFHVVAVPHFLVIVVVVVCVCVLCLSGFFRAHRPAVSRRRTVFRVEEGRQGLVDDGQLGQQQQR